jgi:4-amino-4-deoxy-L-arabinose transferase-like glycosyltransferase
MPPKKSRDSLVHDVAGLLLAVQAALLAYGAYVHSPVYDETAHVPTGASVWLLGRTDFYPHNPPLVKAVAALPVMAAGAKFDWRGADEHPLRRPEFELGRNFVTANGARSFWLVTLARWACIPFATVGGVIVYMWSSQLFGRLAGLVSLSVWCLGPNILGNAQLCTPDTACASIGIWAAYLFRNWLRQPTWLRAAGAGVVLGMAELTKFTWIVLFPLWIAIWAVIRWRTDSRPALVQLMSILALALFTLNAGYGFQSTFTGLGEFRFQSRALTGERFSAYLGGPGGNRFANTWLASLPVPLPRAYVKGIDLQKHDFETGFDCYLRGEWRRGGWWYYYLYGLAVKVPLGTLALFALAMFNRAAWRQFQLTDALCLLAPALTVFVLVSSQTGINLFLRYVLPAMPFAAVLVGGSVVGFAWRRPLAVFLVCWSSIGSLLFYPHSISYFNELVGGPRNGHKHLLDGNISWGQDLLFLKTWYDQHPEARPLGLVYFGNLDARVAGLEFFLPPRGSVSANNPCPISHDLQGPQPGWYVVDVNFVHGMNRRVLDGEGHWIEPEPTCDFSYFQYLKPVDRIGYSLWVYHVTKEEANRVRAKLGLAELR